MPEPTFSPDDDILTVALWQGGWAHDGGRAAATAFRRLKAEFRPGLKGQPSFDGLVTNVLKLGPNQVNVLLTECQWAEPHPPAPAGHGRQVLREQEPRAWRIRRAARATVSELPERPPGPASPDEYGRLVRASQARLNVRYVNQAPGIRLQSARDVALIGTLFVLGLAPREVVALDASAFDGDRRRLQVGGRVLPVPGHVGDALRLLAERRPSYVEPLFPSCDHVLKDCDRRGSEDLARTVVNRRWAEALVCGGATYAPPTPLDLRDALRERLRAAGLSSRAVRRLFSRKPTLSEVEDQNVMSVVETWEHQVRLRLNGGA